MKCCPTQEQIVHIGYRAAEYDHNGVPTCQATGQYAIVVYDRHCNGLLAECAAIGVADRDQTGDDSVPVCLSGHIVDRIVICLIAACTSTRAHLAMNELYICYNRSHACDYADCFT